MTCRDTGAQPSKYNVFITCRAVWRVPSRCTSLILTNGAVMRHLYGAVRLPATRRSHFEQADSMAESVDYEHMEPMQ